MGAKRPHEDLIMSGLADGIGGFLAREEPGPVFAGLAAGDLFVATGRGALQVVIEQTGARVLHLPDWHCDTLREPAARLGVAIRTYPVDAALGPTRAPDPGPGELLLVIDAFGLHGEATCALADAFGARLVVDRTQAMFADPPAGAWSFDSVRKFLGVMDGARLTGPAGWQPPILPPGPERSSVHLELRAAGLRDEAYTAFAMHEASLSGPPVAATVATRAMLARLDPAWIRSRRRANWRRLHAALAELGTLDLPAEHPGVPFAYPLLASTDPDREAMLAARVFVPTLWPERLHDEGRVATIARRLLPLPLDQRYEGDAMARVIRVARAALEVNR